VLQEVRDGQVEVGIRHGGLDDLTKNFDKIGNRFVIAIVVAAGLMGSAILAAAGEGTLLRALAIVGFVVATVMGVWLVWGVIRSGRL
jgi:ubiquinone biosynthesis protein